MLKNKKAVLGLAAATMVALVMLAGAQASAALVTVTQERMGEANPEAVNGGALVHLTGVTATVGNPLNGVGGVPTWSVDTPAAYQLPLGASTFSVATNGASFIYGGGQDTANDLVGMETWVKTDNVTQVAWIALNGDHGGAAPPYDGYGFYLNGDGKWRAHLPGVVMTSSPDSPAAVAGEWTHLAVVFDSAAFNYGNGHQTGAFLVNGAVVDWTYNLPVAPTGMLSAGACVGGSYGANPFNGKIDELRIFHLANSGDFNPFAPSGLNYAIPEPMTMALLGLGGVLALVRRQRR